ncbi:MAG: AAA family ATPase [bacterium]
MVKHIHILGASGSGTTTLGQEISKKYDLTHFDADDYFWLPTDPPYKKKRPIKKRRELLAQDTQKVKSWVISGSFCGWGDIFISYFDLVIYLWVPAEIRIRRLEKRQKEKFGQEILPGGKMHKTHKKFLRWASTYDQGGLNMRSKVKHELWMAKLNCPILRIEGEYSIKESMNLVEKKIQKIHQNH